MITTNPKEFFEAFNQIQKQDQFRPKTMNAAMLVTPQALAINSQSAQDNLYMDADQSIDLEKAYQQHQNVARIINELGLPIITFAGISGQDDGCFPNNVYGTIEGRFIVGRMFHQVRQQEANRQDIRNFFTNTMNRELVDLSQKQGVCELTGSLVIDRAYNVGFCGLSTRADEEGCKSMHEAFRLKHTLQFKLSPDEYHTNIVLAVLAGKVCLVYDKAFQDPAIPKAIAEFYAGRTAMISREEKENFAANCIAVTENDLLMSARAQHHLTSDTKELLERNGFNIHSVEISEIEKAGGSLRCLIAEVF